jgi:hypothetical protein
MSPAEGSLGRGHRSPPHHGRGHALLGRQQWLIIGGRQPKLTAMSEATKLATAAGSRDPATGLRSVAALRRLLKPFPTGEPSLEPLLQASLEGARIRCRLCHLSPRPRFQVHTSMLCSMELLPGPPAR